jgi:hypothetical protein
MRLSSRQVFAKSSSTVTTITFLIATVVFLSTFASIAITKQSAFADGLTQEQLSASLGNRKADLLIKMNPAVVTRDLRTRAKTYC